MNAAKIAERLKGLRNARGMSQADVAKEIRFAQTTVSDWESGRSEPSATALLLLGRLLQSSIDYLVGATEHPLALRPGDWIVDLDVLDGAMAGKKVDPDEGLAWPVPQRFRVVTSSEIQVIQRKVRDALRGKAK